MANLIVLDEGTKKNGIRLCMMFHFARTEKKTGIKDISYWNTKKRSYAI